MFCGLCNIRGEYRNHKRPHGEPLGVSVGIVHRAECVRGSTVLAHFVFYARREGRKRGLFEDFRGIDSRILLHSDNLPHGNLGDNADGLLDCERVVANLHHVYRGGCHQGADNVAQGRRCGVEFCRCCVFDNQQCEFGWGSIHYIARSGAHRAQQPLFFALPRYIPPGDTALFGGYVYEMDFPLFHTLVAPGFGDGVYTDRLCGIHPHTRGRTRLSGGWSNICELSPHSDRAAAHTPHACEHV